MRTPTRTKGRRQQVSRTYSIPAPTGGWNTRDNLAAMDSKDAVTMDNWFPIPSEVMLRKGSTHHVTGFTGPVESLLAYQSATASKLFACVDVGATAEIVDVTAADIDGTPAAASVSALTNARFQHVNFSNSGGSFLLAVNGADKMRIYTGSAWTADGGGTYTVTNVDTASCSNIALWKRRVWLVEKASLKTWYLPTDAIAGAASLFDFRPIFSRGGYILAMNSWTLDAGAGLDDHLVIATSEGEVAVYKGTDPSSADTFALVGVWFIGTPIGARCMEKFGGDLLIICKEGLLPFSKALMSSRVNTKSALTDKIQASISEVTTLYGDNFGWQILPYPQENMLLLNIPVGSRAHQYVMNTISGAWCRFRGWDAKCWAEFNGSIYYGSGTTVEKAWTGTADNGANIVGEVQQAFSYFGSQKFKCWKMARPILRCNIVPGMLVGINTDFDKSSPTGQPSFVGNVSAEWDDGVFDSDIWGGGLEIHKEWQSVFGCGYSASMHIKTTSKQSKATWSSTDYVLEDGAIL